MLLLRDRMEESADSLKLTYTREATINHVVAWNLCILNLGENYLGYFSVLLNTLTNYKALGLFVVAPRDRKVRTVSTSELIEIREDKDPKD